MEDQAVIESNAKRWFLIAGLVAIGLVAFLMKADNLLTFSKREQVLGQTLKELRGAQTNLPSRPTDDRQLITVPANAGQ